jgi:hypothetical protein
MTKAEKINIVIGLMRGQAIVENRHFDGVSLFFSLAFMGDKKFNSICKLLNV